MELDVKDSIVNIDELLLNLMYNWKNGYKLDILILGEKDGIVEVYYLDGIVDDVNVKVIVILKKIDNIVLILIVILE